MAKRAADKTKEGAHPFLAELQGELYRVIRTIVFQDNANSPWLDYSISQVRCINRIAESEGLRMAELAERLGLKLPAASRIVDRLVRRNMVERRSDEVDRRVVRLALTATARRIIKKTRAARTHRLEKTLTLMSDHEARQVLGGVRLLAGAAEKAMGVAAQPPASADPFVELMPRRRRTRSTGTTQ